MTKSLLGQKPEGFRMILLSRAKRRARRFSAANVVDTIAKLREQLAGQPQNSLWISYDRSLTEAMIRLVEWEHARLGQAVFVHDLAPQSIPAISACFDHFAYAMDDSALPPNELAEVLESDNREDLFIGGSVDLAGNVLTLWRGNLEPLTVPFTAFAASGDGTKPDFGRFSVVDCGQTIRLGDYEAASDAILYEHDARYRRRIKKQRAATDQSLGASLRRLRKQKGLTREDFAPGVTAKTIARIESGQVTKIQQRTLGIIAARLDVKPEEIGSF